MVTNFSNGVLFQVHRCNPLVHGNKIRSCSQRTFSAQTTREGTELEVMARAPLSAVLLALLLCATPIVNAVGNTPSWHPRGAKTARENASGASLSRESAEDMEAGEADEVRRA